MLWELQYQMSCPNDRYNVSCFVMSESGRISGLAKCCLRIVVHDVRSLMLSTVIVRRLQTKEVFNGSSLKAICSKPGANAG